ncbi:MAG: ferrous iron transport protein B [Ardenticatenia bacterium]|nr:ferrous iron transport protein B [Ardenticatenia bacterium]
MSTPTPTPTRTRVRAMLTHDCEACPLYVNQLGIDLTHWDHLVALAGNPNTGKSTLFNRLTGLKQHVGNWPGKTVTRAEGGFEFNGKRYKVVDLPGTYSLLSASVEEEVARDFVLFGHPDVVIIVVDATALERNLNLVLQVLEITDKVVVALNMMDEAKRKGIHVDHRRLARELGVPVVPIVARTGEGVSYLMQAVEDVAEGRISIHPRRVALDPALNRAVEALIPRVQALFPNVGVPRWVAIRLLDGDLSVEDAVRTGRLGTLAPSAPAIAAETGPTAHKDNGHIAEGEALVRQAHELRHTLATDFRDRLVEAIYAEATRIAQAAVRAERSAATSWEERIDRLVTHPIWGLPLMLLGLAVAFWITIVGANYPSELLARLLFAVEDVGVALFQQLGVPWWITGFLWQGVYRGLAWVVSVMLPPMAIFFPIFTILEDLGYLPRVAFNLDWLFKRVGAHGKQALTMTMGFGCNAAGVIATRIIESPRERLIAILTNNFVPCNGRWPTLIMLGTIFVAAAFPPELSAIIAAGAVVGAVVVGIFFTFVTSWLLSRTLLRGEASAFTLELPPYRRPDIKRILYTSLIDRTIFVLWRAVIMAAPAGGLIWILANIYVGGTSLAQHIASFLDPFGRLLGLDGVILLAYIIAIPANEIVVPTMIMVYSGAGAMVEAESLAELRALFVDGAGWTLLTAISLMLFAVLHNPCSTTILTIWKETRSAKWATVGALMPLAIAFLVTFLVAQSWALLARF